MATRWLLRLSLFANLAFIMRTVLYGACYNTAPVDDGDDMMNEYQDTLSKSRADNDQKLLRLRNITKSPSSPKVNSNTRGAVPMPDLPVGQCSAEQLRAIKRQLPSEDCEKHQRAPFNQRCSHTYATKCPDQVWVDDFYTRFHTNSNSTLQESLVGIFVGCNKGMDAVDTLRMLSGNPKFDKNKWRDTFFRSKTLGKTDKNAGVCLQAVTPMFEIPEGTQAVDAMVHCIEPLPVTARELSRSARELGWASDGLTVSHAAVARENGMALFPDGGQLGKENNGIANGCGNNCKEVTVYDLDTYVEKYAPDVPINILSIDVEGYDSDVILGGNRTLRRVEYLEFEYNWMGSWKAMPLSTLISHLDQMGFTCYWPGFDRTIWRITGCFLKHYNLHYWSNVACINRRMDSVRSVAETMETMFLETIERGDGALRDFDHRFVRNISKYVP
ncbi:hypothetical protein THAOC_11408 [Thalassiosira oceanica]|uniref:Methyltransferase FkbM domain-containing protein n=1 Tax=Thalassiosira oceanica TaxID=159749 RepID=K0T2M8_THAOC|nr:hypothetical protein THAOC_11408 [Thalassiosira oceanica]|eukprot:EJK67541.1 hypothetical protein THAOC_11408 [Thalassiosira oceanica]